MSFLQCISAHKFIIYKTICCYPPHIMTAEKHFQASSSSSDQTKCHHMLRREAHIQLCIPITFLSLTCFSSDNSILHTQMFTILCVLTHCCMRHLCSILYLSIRWHLARSDDVLTLVLQRSETLIGSLILTYNM